MLQHNYSGFILETGTDEAGRGCLAGPVTAAAVILPTTFRNELLNDSKLLTKKNREFLKPIIEELAVCFAVIHVESTVIDATNILHASIRAMQESILKLKPQPEYIIVDGNSSISENATLIEGKVIKNIIKRYSEKNANFFNSIPFRCIIKGDSKFLSIAAASVLAKTYRDAYMNKIHEEFPMYNWKQNKGYPSKEHREAIRKYGVTKYHRLTFKLLPKGDL